ncbi:MAG TPA: zf-HC2 domain-containing protein [Terriglobales bacterium]|jgi:anti-sigma factor RsiW
MDCETCLPKLDACLDGELDLSDARLVADHLATCPTCARVGLARVQQKRAVSAAATTFKPDPAFRARIEKSIGVVKPNRWSRGWLPLLATVMVLVIASFFFLDLKRGQSRDQQVLAELADQHVMTLASANPVDVVSTDRHTVKPWFEGKIPFAFNLPDLGNSGFELVGGKVAYLSGSPGAELIFRIRQHRISVFIFDSHAMQIPVSANAFASFNVRSWNQNGLWYLLIGDLNQGDSEKLRELLKGAG